MSILKKNIMEIKKTTKPLKPKNIHSQFCIKDFLDNLLKNAYIITLKNDIRGVHATCSKNAKNKFRKRYPKQKILTVKKIK